MSEEPFYQITQGAMMRSWVLGHMLRGAGYAAAFVIAVGLSLWVLYGISLLLPEESKQAPAPMGSLIVALPTVA